MFWIDALTFLASFACIRRLTALTAGEIAAPSEEVVRFRGAMRLPLVRAVLPATAGVALGLGALFSLGIVFVGEVLDASDTQFGFLIALFGLGAVGGLAVLARRRGEDPVVETRRGVAVIGGVVAGFSLAGSLTLAFLGAVAFGAAAAFTLASGMGALQSRLDGDERVAAFAVFHVVIRVGLGVAALGAGLAGDLLGNVHWPVVGELEPSRVVLLCSGLLILATSVFVRERGGPHRPEPAS